MKRRSNSVLLVCYSQIRQVATAAIPNPRPDSTVSPPPPNLDKWRRLPPTQPTAQPEEPSPGGQRAPQESSSLSSSSQQSAQQINSMPSRNPSGKWARPYNDNHNYRPLKSSSPVNRSRNTQTPRMLERDKAPHIGLPPRREAWPIRPPKPMPAPPRIELGKLGIRTRRETDADVKQWVEVDGKLEISYASYIPPVEDEKVERVRKPNWDKVNLKMRRPTGSRLRGHEADGSGSSNLNMSIRARLREGEEREERHKARLTRKILPDVFIPSTVSVGQLARLLNVRLKQLQKKMAAAGMTQESAYDHVLTSDYAALLVGEFNRNPVINDEAAFDIYPRSAHPDASTLPLRPPIVTIMGHVDHGKTTLLDTLRSASVAKGEAGGITQHIGAFSVPVPAPESRGESTKEQPRTITFLDTPGHAAFSAMRARGARATDIIVLVVAADDGVMPQTREVIELAKKDENVGVVVAINKVDKPSANVDNVTHALMTEGIQLESYGGETPGVEVSGLTGQGLDSLVETISAMAEMQDLRAEQDGQVHGYVLESNIRKGLGPVATVLIVRGCLTTASHIIAGTSHGKVRVMNDSAGAPVKAAYPGMAVAVSGWRELPNAGDEVLTGSEADVKKAVANRQRKAVVEASFVDMEAINAQRIDERRKEEDKEEGAKDEVQAVESGPKELRLVIKGDVSGSVEAITGALQGIGNKSVVVKIVSTGVGDVSESDVMMAQTAEGMIIAFSVNISRAVENIAASNDVPIYSSAIIYRVMEEVRSRIVALLPPVIETKVTGEAQVLELFGIHLKGRRTKQVAGCRVINGLAEKSRKARVIRNGVTVHQGSLDALKQGKQDTLEVRKGTECGISFADFEDLRKDDLIQMYEEIEKPGTL